MALKNILWVENYRPQKLDDLIIPDRLKAEFRKFVEDGECPNLLLAGPAGTGKTTAARVLANELGADFYMINGSKENGIDIMRTKVESFAATVSVMSTAKVKIMCIDEADGLSGDAQKTLRGMTEEFWKNCRFIFTCNYKNRVIPALHSRCTTIDFGLSDGEKTKMMAQFMKRVMFILKENDVKFDPPAVAAYIQSMFPDFRKTLNELQRYATCGTIDAGILKNVGDESIEEINAFLKEKDFRTMREWVSTNPTIDTTSLFDRMYSKIPEYILPQSQPDLILVLDEYQTKALTALNPKINIAACMVQLMACLEWKE